MAEPAIIIHAGAWSVPDEAAEANVAGVKLAARIGYKVLKNGGSALDAAEAAITSLENDKTFNAGAGGSLNAIGQLEMDAVIMEGRHLKAGGVAAVRDIRNPIQLARKVLEETQHVLVVGDGACRLAENLGIPRVDSEVLLSDYSKEEHRNFDKYKKAVGSLMKGRDDDSSPANSHDTVGACALDTSGDVAFGTSTGGIPAQLPGRVGDSPIIGCGGYCDNGIGAVSTTGHGESISKVCLARHITGKMSEGFSIEKGIQEGLKYMEKRVKGHGGAVGLDKDGNPGFAFTTKRMPWCSIREDTMHYGINPGEDFCETV
ncbi:isoaspartyl peptidase/L-asparaginase-like [Lineus longissimus]|uniref:isoaspartyl peptidase/L-asparaginase-like n=1 Tax=Lineus longissimus TaxID=88925 RepID=UPI002B4F02B3